MILDIELEPLHESVPGITLLDSAFYSGDWWYPREPAHIQINFSASDLIALQKLFIHVQNTPKPQGCYDMGLRICGSFAEKIQWLDKDLNFIDGDDNQSDEDFPRLEIKAMTVYPESIMCTSYIKNSNAIELFTERISLDTLSELIKKAHGEEDTVTE